MSNKAKAFLIDLVRIQSLMRVFVFNEQRFTSLDLSRQLGIGSTRIEAVLYTALNTDFRDEQLEMLVSQMSSMHAVPVPDDIARWEKRAYPPIPIFSALTGLNTQLLTAQHSFLPPERLERALASQFDEAVEQWIADNVKNAEAVIELYESGTEPVIEAVTPPLSAGSFIPDPPTTHGLGITDSYVAEQLSKHLGVDPENIGIIGNL